MGGMIQTHKWRQSKQEVEMPSLAQYKLFEASIFGVFLMMLNFNSYSIKHLAITCSVFLRMIHQPEACRRINIGWMAHCIGNRICNQTLCAWIIQKWNSQSPGNNVQESKMATFIGLCGSGLLMHSMDYEASWYNEVWFTSHLYYFRSISNNFNM